MLSLPWSCVTALKLEPVGPIAPAVFGLRWVGAGYRYDPLGANIIGPDHSLYAIIDLPRATQTRDLLGSMMYDPRPIQGPFKPAKHPWYITLCNLHQEVSR